MNHAQKDILNIVSVATGPEVKELPGQRHDRITKSETSLSFFRFSEDEVRQARCSPNRMTSIVKTILALETHR